jgi:hypothetical protein
MTVTGLVLFVYFSFLFFILIPANLLNDWLRFPLRPVYSCRAIS